MALAEPKGDGEQGAGEASFDPAADIEPAHRSRDRSAPTIEATMTIPVISGAQAAGTVAHRTNWRGVAVGLVVLELGAAPPIKAIRPSSAW